MDRFLCWLDNHGNRGYIHMSTPHVLTVIANVLYLEAPGVNANFASDEDVFIVAKIEHALDWVKNGNSRGKLAVTCAEKGVV